MTTGTTAKALRKNTIWPTGATSPSWRTSADIAANSSAEINLKPMPLKRSLFFFIGGWCGILLGDDGADGGRGKEQRRGELLVRLLIPDAFGTLRLFGGFNRGPDPLRRRRHVDVADPVGTPERVEYCIHDSRT